MGSNPTVAAICERGIEQMPMLSNIHAIDRTLPTYVLVGMHLLSYRVPMALGTEKIGYEGRAEGSVSRLQRCGFEWNDSRVARCIHFLRPSAGRLRRQIKAVCPLSNEDEEWI